MAEGLGPTRDSVAASAVETALLADIHRWPQRIANQVDGLRLFHGRGQCFAGLEWLTVDYFAPVLWVVCYRPPPEAFWRVFAAQLSRVMGPQCEAIIVQNRYEKPVVSYCLKGEIPEEGFAFESGARFALQFSGRQNIGYFMDMAPQRAWLCERVKGRRVLNLFAYTCAFSVAAARAGAAEVINVDMSKAALRQGQKNHALNNLDHGDCQLRFASWDIFKSWGRLSRLGPFDVVVCDPPSQQKGSFDARRQYPKLLGRLASMVSPGADLMLCLNAPYLPGQFLIDAMAEQFPDAHYMGAVAGRADFPERDPERGLKVLHFRCPD